MENKDFIIVLMLILFLIGLGILVSMNVKHKDVYIYASNITSVGLANTSTNISLVNEMNNGYWVGEEQNAQPWAVYVYYKNITMPLDGTPPFNFIENSHKYNSTTETPSSHIISEYIWCVNHNEYMELHEFTNENNWYYEDNQIINSHHFVMANGTAIIKYDHPSNGISAHRFNIDVARLVLREHEVSI